MSDTYLKKRIAVFGSTGSIGTQALDVIRSNPALFETEILTAQNNAELLIQQALEFNPNAVVIGDEAKYNIVGRLADTSKVKDLFEDEKLKAHVKVHGPVSNEEMHKVLDDSQIFILLSEIQSDGDFEGFGIAVIEANYFGLPAIGSKNSGLEDAICNGVSGVLVDPHDPDEVSTAIQTIKSDYEKFSGGARQWAMEHHWSKIIQRYIKAIEGIK